MRQNIRKENSLFPIEGREKSPGKARTDFEEALAQYTRQKLSLASQARDLINAFPDRVFVSGEPGRRLKFKTQVDIPTERGEFPAELSLEVQRLEDGSLGSSLNLRDIDGRGLYRLDCTSAANMEIAENTGLFDAFSSFQPEKDIPDIVTDNFAESILKVNQVSLILSQARPRLPEPGIGETFGRRITLADLQRKP